VSYIAQKTAASSPLNFGRIAKPLRGGGGGGAGAAPASTPTPITGGTSGSPLARLQNDEGGYVVFSTLSIPGLIIFLPDLVGIHFGGNCSILKCFFFFAAKRASWFFNSR